METVTLELRQRQERERWANDPAAYCTERLGLTLWPKLIDILESVRDNPQTAVKSANGVGKTEIAVALVLWWLETHEKAIVLTTGSNWNTLENVLWPRLHKYVKTRKLFPRAQLTNTMLYASDENYAFAKSTNEPEGIQGIHSPNLLQIVEESSGVEPAIADAISGNATGQNDRRVYLGNPLIPSGPFYGWCHSAAVNTITISAFDHPNVVTGENQIPGAVSREKLESACAEWGHPCSPDEPGAVHLYWCNKYYKLDHRGTPRIKGEFPEAGITSMFSRSALVAAMNRSPVKSGYVAIGVDPAQSPNGDETSIAVVCPDGVLAIEGQVGMKQTEIAGRAKQLQEEHEAGQVAIDCSGGYGGGAASILEEQGVPTLSVIFSEKSSDPTRWANLKAEMYYLFKEQVETNPNYFLPDDPVLLKQASEIRFKPNSRGQDIIESKDEYKKRNNGESPDRLEACVIGCYAVARPNAPILPTSQFEAYEALKNANSRFNNFSRRY